MWNNICSTLSVYKWPGNKRTRLGTLFKRDRKIGFTTANCWEGCHDQGSVIWTVVSLYSSWYYLQSKEKFLLEVFREIQINCSFFKGSFKRVVVLVWWAIEASNCWYGRWSWTQNESRRQGNLLFGVICCQVHVRVQKVSWQEPNELNDLSDWILSLYYKYLFLCIRRNDQYFVSQFFKIFFIMISWKLIKMLTLTKIWIFLCFLIVKAN